MTTVGSSSPEFFPWKLILPVEGSLLCVWDTTCISWGSSVLETKPLLCLDCQRERKLTLSYRGSRTHMDSSVSIAWNSNSINFSPALHIRLWATSPPSPLKSRSSFLWLPEQLFLQGVSHLSANSFGSQYLGLLTSFPNQTGRFGQPYQLQFLTPILNTRATEHQPLEVRQCITGNLGMVYKCTVVLWVRDTGRMLCLLCHSWRRLVVMFPSMEPYKRTTESHPCEQPSHQPSRVKGQSQHLLQVLAILGH